MVVLFPSTCTDQLQPLDLSINKPAKDHLKKKFTEWYAHKVTEQINSGKRPDEVSLDTKLAVVKEIGASWLVSMHN